MLVEYEFYVLKSLLVKDCEPNLIAGAAFNATFEHLHSSGFVLLDGSITKLGEEAILEFENNRMYYGSLQDAIDETIKGWWVIYVFRNINHIRDNRQFILEQKPHHVKGSVFFFGKGSLLLSDVSSSVDHMNLTLLHKRKIILDPGLQGFTHERLQGQWLPMAKRMAELHPKNQQSGPVARF